MRAWLKTSGNFNDGYFGARMLSGGPILGETRLTQPLAGYTQVTVQFNSGANHSVERFAGLWATSDTWMQVDDFSLTRN
ncbi:MAG TPA: hypothetical protein VEU33_25120 [Archangium sp.]|nr:hypothetical protein [Archangium sp.]